MVSSLTLLSLSSASFPALSPLNEPPAGEYEVNVEAEPNFEGALVLLEPPRDPALVPFAGERVVSY